MQEPLSEFTMEELEEFIESLFSNKDFAVENDWQPPTISFEEFNTWRGRTEGRQRGFRDEYYKNLNESEILYKEVDRIKKVIIELHFQIDIAYERKEYENAYHLFAQQLGCNDYYKTIADNIPQKNVSTNVRFGHYLNDKGLDILGDLKEWYYGKEPLELTAMLFALVELNLFDSEMNIFEHKKQLGELITSTFGGEWTPEAFKKYMGKNPPSRTIIKLQIKIIQGFFTDTSNS